jgi:predicted phosphodiesterase
MVDRNLINEVLSATAPKPAADAEQVTQRRDGDTLEARSTSRRIKTVEDLLEHIGADLTKYEVAASEATKWECGVGDGNGGVSVTELHRVFVRLKPKAGPGVQECVAALIDAAASRVAKKAVPARRRPARAGLWQVIVVADTHYGKYAWGKTTGPAGGGDYDLDVAERLVSESSAELIAVGNGYKPTRRTIAYVGDLLHYDNPRGQTTALTQVERDGRLQKMMAVGWGSLAGIVERSAEDVPTDVIVVNGNHDETLTWAFQRVLKSHFRRDKRVSVSDEFTGRQYIEHGKNLIGFAHGHKAKRKLASLMALEAKAAWSRTICREWHTGHYHSQAAEWRMPIETVEGVIIRQAPSLSAADDWHSENGFLGSRRAMETYIYRPEGGLTAMHIAGPRDD